MKKGWIGLLRCRVLIVSDLIRYKSSCCGLGGMPIPDSVLSRSVVEERMKSSFCGQRNLEHDAAK